MSISVGKLSCAPVNLGVCGDLLSPRFPTDPSKYPQFAQQKFPMSNAAVYFVDNPIRTKAGKKRVVDWVPEKFVNSIFRRAVGAPRRVCFSYQHMPKDRPWSLLSWPHHRAVWPMDAPEKLP